MKRLGVLAGALLSYNSFAADFLQEENDIKFFGNKGFITGENSYAVFTDAVAFPRVTDVHGEPVSNVEFGWVLGFVPGTYDFLQYPDLHIYQARSDITIGPYVCLDGLVGLDAALAYGADPERLPSLEREIILYKGDKVMQRRVRDPNPEGRLEEPYFSSEHSGDILPCSDEYFLQGRSTYDGEVLHETEKIPFK